MIRWKIVVILGLSFFSFPLRAQSPDYNIEWYTIEDGLTHNAIKAVMKDNYGFVWVYTMYGMSRFDGYQFENYYPALMDGDFGRFDSRGGFWFFRNASQQHVRFSYRKGDYQNIEPFCAPGTILRGLFWFDLGTEWIISDTILYKLKWQSDTTFTVKEYPFCSEYGKPLWMEKLPNGEIWMILVRGLIHVEELTDTARLTGYDLVAKTYDNEELQNFWINISDKGYWGRTPQQLIITELQPVTEERRSPYLLGRVISIDRPDIGLTESSTILDVVRAGGDNIYFKTYRGVYSYSFLKDKMVRIYQDESRDSETISHGFLYDREGILWTGTKNGLMKIIIGNRNFQVLNPEPSIQEQDLLKFNQVLIDRNRNLWIGSMGNGLYHSIPASDGRYKQFSSYMHDPDDPFSIAGNNSSTIFEDSRGNIYMGPWSYAQTVEMSDSKPRFRLAEMPRMPYLNSFHEDCYGNILILNGIFHDWIYNPLTGEGYSFFIDKERNHYGQACFYKSEDNSCYFRNQNGLYRLDGPILYFGEPYEGKRIRNNTPYPEKLPELLDSSQYRNNYAYPEKTLLLLDSSNIGTGVFIVTEHEGYKDFWLNDPVNYRLLQYRLPDLPGGKGEENNENEVKMELVGNYSTENGLSSNSIYEILEDNRKRIWVTTENGLNCIDPSAEEISRYYKQDGLPTNRFSRGGFKDHSGRLYFCTTYGVVFFHPDSIIAGSPPTVYITEMRLFNKPVQPGQGSPLKESIISTDRVILPHNQNFLSFAFAALDYSNPKEVRYQYMMEGLDHDWVDAGERRIADYPDLKHGNYTFRVIASNSNGKWNRAGNSVNVIVKAPPWLQWWSISLYVITVILIALWYRRYLLNRARLRTAVEVERIEKEKVLEVERMKSRFFTNVSHEFRTPLTLILGPIADLVKQKSRRVEINRNLLEIIERNALRLQKLINQLLDISKLETGNIKLRPVQGNLEEYVKTIILSFLSLAESRNIRYTYELPGTNREVFFDGDKVEKILTNLISNAFKFTDSGGEVKVKLEFQMPAGQKEPQHAVLQITDTGKGIPQEKLDRVFDRFYQVDHPVTNDGITNGDPGQVGHDGSAPGEGGTGIGLSLTKELVELYRGNISVKSDVGAGSTFTVILPASKGLFHEDELSTEADKKEMSLEATDRWIESVKEGDPEVEGIPLSLDYRRESRILVVEDNADLRSYITSTLDGEYEVLEAENGKEGLESALEYIPDLIISDLMMPGMDGMQMCRQLKADERTSHIPVVILTARADRESKLEGLTTGADDYIIKPFDAEELQVRVRNLIEQREKLREKFRKEFLQPGVDLNPESYRDVLVKKLFRVIETRFSDFDFTVDELGEELHYSRAQFFRKVNAITGTSPNELLRLYRIKKAAILLRSGRDNITTIMYNVGFKSPSHFARAFRKYYGKNPSEFRADA